MPDLPLNMRGKSAILNASLTREILSNDFVAIKVRSNDILDVKINDYITVDGRKYRMNTPPEWLKQGVNNYEYDLRFEGQMYDLNRVIFKNEDGTGFATTTDFSLIGTIEHYITVILNNMKRFSPDWEIGTFDVGETKTISFASDSCLSALQKICTEFGVEFRIDYNSATGKYIINTGNFGADFPYTFSYGKGNGLYTLSLKNVDQSTVINRLYINGGTENLRTGYRNYSDKLKFDEKGYLEDTALIDLMGLFEGVADFPEVYPKRKGKITEVVDKTTFIDSSMDFDLSEKDSEGHKYLQAGVSPKINFLTGDLAGYSFELPKKDYYDHSKKQFKIVQQKSEKDVIIPDDNGAFSFKVGDEYNITEIAMPDTYVDNAEAELRKEGETEFDKKKQALVQYDLKISPLFLKSLNNGVGQIMFDIGDYIRVEHKKLSINKRIRVIAVTKDLMKEGEYTVNVSDEFQVNEVRQLFYDVKDIKTTLNLTGALNVNKSQLGYRTTEELKNLVFDPDDYFDADNIRPNSIETNMLSVGARSQQLSCSCTFNLNELGDPNRLTVTAGQLYSQTMDKIWQVAGQVFTLPDVNSRYAYAKCQKGSNQGVIYISTERIKFDEDVNDYYFLIGILHSVQGAKRIFSPTIGSTTITGGLVRTGIIQDNTGTNYFNLDTGEIKGNITFNINSPAFQQVANNLIIGSSNILRHSDFVSPTGYYSPWAYGNNGVIEWLPGVLRLNCTEFTTGGSVGIGISTWGFDFSKIRNKVLTLSYKVRSNIYTNIRADVFSYGGLGEILYSEIVNVGTEWTRVKVVFRTLDVAYNDLYFYVWQAEGAIEPGQTIDMKEPMLEWGNVASDWSLANEDVAENLALANANAQNAQNIANQAQQSANTANAMLADISSDNKLTPVEKQQLKTEWLAIVDENPIINQQAGVYSIPTVNYNNSFQALNAYINSNGLLNDMNITSDIDGNYFRQAFIDYYREKVSLLKLISDTAKGLVDVANQKALEAQQVATNAQNSANNAQSSANTANALLSDIASDNKLTPSEKQLLKKEWDIINEEKPVVNAQASVYALDQTAYNQAHTALSNYVIGNNLLLDMSTSSDIVGITFRRMFADYYTAKVNLLKLVSDKAKALADDAQNTANNANNTANQAIQGVANMQISLNDVKTKTDNFTSIQGGLLMSNIISVGDNQLNQRAFLSGVTDAGGESIRFGAGANYANKNTAPFRVLDNGKLIASNAEISGKINATSGNIAGWDISPTALTSQDGRLIFGEVDSQGWLQNGVMIANDVHPNPAYQGNFIINANKTYNSGNVNNTAALINASGANVFNTALELSASGASGINNALYIGAGSLMLDNNNGFAGIKTYMEFAGQKMLVNGFTGTKTINNTPYYFVHGLLIQ